MHHNLSRIEVERGSVTITKPAERNVTFGTQRLITSIMGWGRVTLPSESALLGVPLPQNIGQKVVQPAPWGLHPFYSHMDGAPLLLEVRAQEFGHRLIEVERSAISEVQSRPSVAHVGGVYAA